LTNSPSLPFVAPHTYTTHPTVELHIHSGRALISALLASLSVLPNLRQAEPGEFTRQALLGGRLDLTQVEGLHDLIEAETEVQRFWALESAGVSITLSIQNDRWTSVRAKRARGMKL
jgi:tRNA modification GTPase